MDNIIAELREKYYLTQKELADLVGVSRVTIYTIERGKSNVSLKLANKLAKVFDMKIEDIFYLNSKEVDDVHNHQEERQDDD